MAKQFPNFANGRTAVTLRYLEEFARALDPNIQQTTADVVTACVLPRTKCGCRYVDLLDPTDVGLPQYFVSHHRGAVFVDLVDALSQHFKDEGTAAEDVCLWLDIFAINQHPGQQQVDDLANLHDVVCQTEKTLLVMDKTGQVLRRVWCLFEIWKTVDYHGVGGLVVLAKNVDLLGLKDIFLKLNIEDAQATFEADRCKILDDIKSTIGAEAMNQSIRRQEFEGGVDGHIAQAAWMDGEYKALVESARLEMLMLAPLKDTKLYMYFAALDKAGQMATLAGMYGEAQPLMMECLDLCKKLLGHNNSHTASCENNIAGLLRYQGKLIESEPHQRRALQISEAVSGDSSETATYLGNLAQLLQAQARNAEAEPLLLRALQITDSRTSSNATSKGGKKAAAAVAAAADSPQSAVLLNSLASLYLDMGRPDDALPLYQRALALALSTMSPEDPEVVVYLCNLGGVLQDLRRFEEAEDLQRKALNLCGRNLGREHPMTASCMSNLAEMLTGHAGFEGRMEEAESLAREALQIRQKLLGNEHPATGNSLNNLAGILMQQGRYGEAEAFMRQALEVAEKAMGSLHPVIADRLHNLASLLAKTGREEEAEQLYERAMQAREKHFGRDHVDTITTVACVAAVKYSLGRMEEAAQLYKRTVVAQRKRAIARPSQQLLLTSISNLVMALHKCGQHSEALEYSKEAIKISSKLYGSDSKELQKFVDMRDALETHVASPQNGASGAKRPAPSPTTTTPPRVNATVGRRAARRSDPSSFGHKPRVDGSDADLAPIQGSVGLLRHRRTSDTGPSGGGAQLTPCSRPVSSPFKSAAGASTAVPADTRSTHGQASRRLLFEGVGGRPPPPPEPAPTVTCQKGCKQSSARPVHEKDRQLQEHAGHVPFCAQQPSVLVAQRRSAHSAAQGALPSIACRHLPTLAPTASNSRQPQGSRPGGHAAAHDSFV